MEEIRNCLTKIENESKVKILFAAEAGSRAWGFPSKDSDYDIRFIYIRPLKETFKLKQERDNIEITVDDFDMAGWELKKALGLSYKSNAALLEWFSSPIIYIDENNFKEILRKLAMNYVDENKLIKHYSAMAQRCLSDHLKTPMVKLKKYFYCIRPLMAAQYVADREEDWPIMPPLDFMTLLKTVNLASDTRLKIEKLYERKINNESESLTEAADMYLLDWILSGIKRFRNMRLGDAENKSTELLDNFLFETVMEHNK